MSVADYFIGVESTKSETAFSQTSHLDSARRDSIEHFLKADGYRLETPLVDESYTMVLCRSNDNNIGVQLFANGQYGKIGHCLDDLSSESHYSWEIAEEHRGKKLGSLLRSVKEVSDGTLRYERANKKTLALPLIAWGYAPLTFSENGISRDILQPVSEDQLMHNFSTSDDSLQRPLLFEYNPLKAKQFLTKLNYQKKKR